MKQHIGEDFTKQIELNLFPGVDIPRGSTYQVTIVYQTYVNGNITMHNQTMITDSRDLNVIVGRDVRHIDVMMSSMYVSRVIPKDITFSYGLRIDRLILLNLAHQLLHHSK